jgi:hypothetical protein
MPAHARPWTPPSPAPQSPTVGLPGGLAFDIPVFIAFSAAPTTPLPAARAACPHVTVPWLVASLTMNRLPRRKTSSGPQAATQVAGRVGRLGGRKSVTAPAPAKPRPQ